MTASRGGSFAAHSSGAAMSPVRGVAPNWLSFAADASDRVRPQTPCPRPTSSRTTAEPIEPVPPRTKTRNDSTPCPKSARRTPGYDDKCDTMKNIAVQRAGVRNFHTTPSLKKFILNSFPSIRAAQRALLSQCGCDSIFVSDPPHGRPKFALEGVQDK